MTLRDISHIQSKSKGNSNNVKFNDPRVSGLTKEQIVAAMARTKSNFAAARYLHVSYPHYKKYAKTFTDSETGKTLFDMHLNQSGKGIPVRGR